MHRYSDMDDKSAFAFLAAAMSGSGDRGQVMPQSDADDLGRGARCIPDEVSSDRRTGKHVEFVQPDDHKPAEWFWQREDGTRILHG